MHNLLSTLIFILYQELHEYTTTPTLNKNYYKNILYYKSNYFSKK